MPGYFGFGRDDATAVTGVWLGGVTLVADIFDAGSVLPAAGLLMGRY
jgi:hypothetical protein